MNDLENKIFSYWTRRSEQFLSQRREELHDPIAGRWMAEIKKYLPEKKRLKILDVGCGSGFFSVLLAKEGHEITGIDLTPEMIKTAKILAKEEKAVCEYYRMDAQNLDFEDGAFDVVISRNVTWTLPKPEKAYEEWLRVLKSDGILLNFDGDYGKENSEDAACLPENHAHHKVGADMLRENEEIKARLTISAQNRPAWDVEVLRRMGIKKLEISFDVSERIYLKKDAFYNPVPLFLICALKKQL